MVLLDSNVLIEHLSGRLNITDQIRALGSSACYVSSVSVYEILHGSLRSAKSGEYRRVENLLARLPRLPFDDSCAAATAKIRVELEKIGMRIGLYDLMLAGTALAYDLTVITHNTREYERVGGLRIKDWQNGDLGA